MFDEQIPWYTKADWSLMDVWVGDGGETVLAASGELYWRHPQMIHQLYTPV